MILGVGTDLVSVERIRGAMGRSGFVERILTDRERDGELSAEYVAGRWAAKEAIWKCLSGYLVGEGLASGHLGWQAVEVLRGENGAPVVWVAERFLSSEYEVMVSISHEREFALAFAVLQRK